MNTLYEFRGVGFIAPPKNHKDKGLSILCDVNFTVTCGEFIVVTGPSGCGKTTLLRLFNRLADPSSGTINFEGKDIKEHPILELRRRIGWVPQVPVRFPGTTLANLRLPFTLSKDNKFTPEQIDKAIDEMKSLDLLAPKLFDRDASDLSVGEAQRLNLLRALVMKPEVLLLDEPTSALDPESADALLTQIVRIREEQNLTAVMVSHRPDEVARMNGTVMRVEHGQVLKK
jgi:ABC-type proline/glycine betaine transport system ATPase subunit